MPYHQTRDAEYLKEYKIGGLVANVWETAASWSKNLKKYGGWKHVGRKAVQKSSHQTVLNSDTGWLPGTGNSVSLCAGTDRTESANDA